MSPSKHRPSRKSSQAKTPAAPWGLRFKRLRNRDNRFLLLVLMLFAVVSTVLALSWWTGYRLWSSQFPEVSILKTHYPRVNPKLHHAKGEPSFTVQIVKGAPEGWTRLSDISSLAVGAIVVSEDWAYFSHRGYDANQIREALKHDLEKGSFARGASTITQQVAKNVFLSQEKTLWRKLKELFLAVRLDRELGKRKVLETYLNIVEWGPGIFGVSSASRHYFDKSPSELTAREGAFLAMLLPSPIRYSQSFRQKSLTRYAKSTIHRILDKMAQAGYLTEEESQQAKSAHLSFETGPEVQEGVNSLGESEAVEDASEDEESLNDGN